MLEKTRESPLDCKEIQPVHPEGNQSWVFIGRTDAEAETPILWSPHEKSWLIGKDPDAGRDWGQEEKGMTEDEMAGWHHWLDGMGLSKLREFVMGREAWRAVIHGVAKNQTWLSDWTELNWTFNLTQIIKEIFYSHVIGKLRGRFGCSWSLIQKFSNKTNDVFFFCPSALPLMVMASTIMVPQLCPEEKNSYFGFTLIGLVWAHAHFCQWLWPWDWSTWISLYCVIFGVIFCRTIWITK